MYSESCIMNRVPCTLSRGSWIMDRGWWIVETQDLASLQFVFFARFYRILVKMSLPAGGRCIPVFDAVEDGIQQGYDEKCQEGGGCKPPDNG
jgi:hypothetical protein